MKRMIPALLCAALATTVAAAQTAPQTPAAPSAAAPAAAAPSAVTPPADAPAAAPVEPGDALVKPAGTAPATGVAAGGQGHTYNAEGRRDPFLPLLNNSSAKNTLATTAAGRAAGLAGLGVAEVTLRGVLMSQGGYVGMLLGTDEKTYIVRAGDRLADGMIRAITSEMLVIQQQIKDPLSRQKEREVRKMLRHTDGTN